MVDFALAYVRGFVRKDEGQDLIEYALLAALIALGAVVALGAASGNINNVFNAIGQRLTGAIPPAS
jgi:pilus assembly protein Flp/PilA